MATKRRRTHSAYDASLLPDTSVSPLSDAAAATPAPVTDIDADPESTEPTTKLPRNIRSLQIPLLCTLPPTCHPPAHTPTALPDSRALEAHYAKYHAHVCAQRGCSAVFPDARLLELVSG